MKMLKSYSEPKSIRQFRRDMERFFDDVMPFSWTRENGGSLLDTWAPSSDISEDEKEYTLQMDLPGIEKEDVKVSYQEGRLIITGERKHEEKEEKKDYIRRERSAGSFYRAFKLPDEVREDEIKAIFKEGVLNVHIPKAEVSKPKEVKID
ncbi:MAG: Hsp20/alpha crystallin family protein [Balneolaceae bacterium]